MYELKQSPKAWFEKFTQSMKNLEYTQRQTDHIMFMKFSNDGKIVVSIVYVDNIIFFGDDVLEMNKLKKCLASEFEIKDLDPLSYFLGMEVAW